jgi:hypothetical protein
MTVSIDQLAEQTLRRLGVAIIPAADRPPLSVSIPSATIATNALVELGVIAADETPAAADQALALAKVSQVQDSLVSQAIVSWASTGVPQAVAEEYTKMTAIMLASSFGKQADMGAYQTMEGRVRNYALVLTAQVQAVDAVMSIHQMMDAMGLVRWSVFDVPDGIGGAYVQRAAASLAPYFGKQPDAREDVDGLRQFARFTALPSSGAPTPVSYF